MTTSHRMTLVALVSSVVACGREHVELAVDKIACETETMFPSGLWLEVDPSIGDVAVGDIDGDSELDLVVAEYFGQGIGVMRGRGDGTFLARQETRLAGMVEHVALADVDGDGHLDVIATHWIFGDHITSMLDVLRNRGDGTFDPPSIYPLDGHVDAITASDFNEDGLVDVLSGDTALHIRLNRGDGTFGAPLDIDTGADTHVRRFAVADVNTDGHLDVIAAYDNLFEPPGKVGVFLGNGDGTVQAPIEHPLGNASALELADVNHDAKLDLVFGITQQGVTVSVALGAGDGTFSVMQEDHLFELAESDGVGWLAARDLNRDGNLDLIAVTKHDTVSLLYGAGDGSFTGRTDLRVAINWPLANVAADFDHDDAVDLVLGGSDAMQVLLADRTGAFASDATLDFATLGTGASEIIAVGDLDEDGIADLVQSDAGNAVVSFGNGDGTFHSPATIPANDAVALALADFDRDGHRDILVGMESAVATLRGHGDGTFAMPHVIATANVSLLAVADLDSDADLDVMTSGGDVLVNDGNGKLALASNIPVGVSVTGLAIADLDRDGQQDVVFASDTASQVALFRGSGHATFTPATTLSLSSGAFSVGAADLDGDALPELVLTMHYEGSVAVLRNTGGFRFSTRTDYGVTSAPWKMTMTHLSSNGMPAFVVQDAMSSTISIMTSDRDGGLARSVVAPGLLRSSVVIADVDRDQIPDIVAAGPQHGVIIRGQCSP